MVLLLTLSKDLPAIWMQFQQFICTAPIHADLRCKHFECLPSNPYLRCNPEPFSLIQPFAQHHLPQALFVFLQVGYPLLAGATLSE